MRLRMFFPVILVLSGCSKRPATPEASSGQTRGTFAAASGVRSPASGRGNREHRIVPLRPMSGDVEILSGDPEKAGEPFVMRIRELPGTRIPVHSHPVD